MDKKFQEELLQKLTNISNVIYGFASDACIGVHPIRNQTPFEVEISLNEETIKTLNRIADALEAIESK